MAGLSARGSGSDNLAASEDEGRGALATVEVPALLAEVEGRVSLAQGSPGNLSPALLRRWLIEDLIIRGLGWGTNSQRGSLGV
jgi:hypothetical protein